MIDDNLLEEKLAAMLTGHRDLDSAIAVMVQLRNYDRIQVQRMKKRKLELKDQIAKVQNQLIPDIIA